MISTKNLVSEIFEVPREWVFEHYLGLTERLTGQSVKIKSVFNLSEKTPSLCVYLDDRGVYRFKDFSSGNCGDGLSLVESMFNLLSRGAASNKIVNDYNTFILDNEYSAVKEYKAHGKYQVHDFEMRHWNMFDQRFWMSFQIGSKTLDRYNVVPLQHYTMRKVDDIGLFFDIKIDVNFIYGYFKEDGTLYKIYQPKQRDKKFVKVRDYIQGSEQLVGSKYLLILSSLKDVMAFTRLGIKNIEAVAPDSENSMIPESFIKKAKAKYQKVLIMFDNDEPGLEAAKKYKTRYDLDYINLNMSKDLSDSVRDHGIEAVREQLFPLIKQAL